jgi:hypothetical protein
VVLVVILSLIQTAATVVFVNRVDVAQNAVAGMQDKFKAEEAKAQRLEAQLASASADVGTARQQAQSQVNAIQQQLLTVQQQLADRDVKLAQAAAQGSQQSIESARLAEALKASEDTKAKFADQIAELRKLNDDLSKKSGDLTQANADLTSRLEVTERERRNLQEQNQELQNQASRATAAMKDAGINPPAPTVAVGVGRGAPAINATVVEVRPIANIPYATISVGSADRVARGMQFTIQDKQGNFLGFLTVDTVEPNQAAGRLSGPRVPDIKAGNDARTQL